MNCEQKGGVHQARGSGGDGGGGDHFHGALRHAWGTKLIAQNNLSLLILLLYLLPSLRMPSACTTPRATASWPRTTFEGESWMNLVWPQSIFSCLRWWLNLVYQLKVFSAACARWVTTPASSSSGSSWPGFSSTSTPRNFPLKFPTEIFREIPPPSKLPKDSPDFPEIPKKSRNSFKSSRDSFRFWIPVWI